MKFSIWYEIASSFCLKHSRITSEISNKAGRRVTNDLAAEGTVLGKEKVSLMKINKKYLRKISTEGGLILRAATVLVNKATSKTLTFS